MKENEAVTFWKRIDEALSSLGVSIKFMSEITGIDYIRIRDWRFKKRMPNAEALSKISEFLNLSLDYLIKGKLTDSIEPCYQYLVPYINNADETGIALVERALGVSKNRGGAEASSDSTHSMVG